MSLVVFPFKEEDPLLVAANLKTAASHDRVDEVWAVAASANRVMADVASVGEDVSRSTGTTVDVFLQRRMGRYRSGKGDGMNTAIHRAAERGFDRVHFYDADITNFDDGWIDGAEHAADRGYGVVRHRFPRAATDAMITWMVTRPGLAMIFPGTLLPRLGQPLGGEILLGRDALESLASDDFVIARSDWGIDTVLTHATAIMDLGLFEHNAADGKRHVLYGSLTDIRQMVLECLDAVVSLQSRPGPDPGADFSTDPDAPVPEDLKRTTAYDLAATRRSVAQPPTPDEMEVLDELSVRVEHLEDMDARRWLLALTGLIEGFRLGHPAWESAAFRLWAHRVIHYTIHQVSLGYDRAMAYLEETIRHFEAVATPRRSQSAPPG